MKVQRIDDKFVIWRGDEYRPSYFSFFVDGDKSSWTRYSVRAARFQTNEAATEAIEMLRERARMYSKSKRTSAGRGDSDDTNKQSGVLT